MDWGFDLRGVRIDAANVVYSAHVYPGRPRRQWSSRFGRRCSDHPLFIGEWGGNGGDLKWGSSLISSCGKWHVVGQPGAGWIYPRSSVTLGQATTRPRSLETWCAPNYSFKTCAPGPQTQSVSPTNLKCLQETAACGVRVRQ